MMSVDPQTLKQHHESILTTTIQHSNPLTRRQFLFWMRNQEKWSVIRTEGNPTKSKDVFDLLLPFKSGEKGRIVKQPGCAISLSYNV